MMVRLSPDASLFRASITRIADMSEAAFARAGERDRAATVRFLRRVVAESESEPGGPALSATQARVKRSSIVRK
jgi:hypothetical protein